MSYRYHLKSKRLSDKSIKSYQESLELFKDWLIDQSLQENQIDYNVVMSYIEYCKTKGNKDRTVQQKILAIKYYLDARGVKPNPCRGWQLKIRQSRGLPSPLLIKVELDKIYMTYPDQKPNEIRSKVLIGLVVYQGLNGRDINRLSVATVNLEHGVILVKKQRKSAGRSLRIKDDQKTLLEKYIEQTRRQIIGDRSQAVFGDKLIVQYGSRKGLDQVVYTLTLRLRKQHNKFRNFGQLRASVISNWLKDYNLREVQYMAGHKYVSSTERYLEGRIESLQNKLDELHPLK